MNQVKQLYAWYGSLSPMMKTLLFLVEGAIAGVLWNWFTSPSGLCFTKACLTSLAKGMLIASAWAIHNYFKPPKPAVQVAAQGR